MSDQNLYQLIGVSETASVQEIEAAAVKRYNEARNLVNHYSPEVATNASQELNKIERARTILLDPAKKAEYDQSLGITNGVGGLADPSQILGKFSNFGAPPVSLGVAKLQSSQPLQPQQQAVDQLVALNAWVCSKCHTPNPKGTKFCKKCGNAVGMNCPNCGKLIEVSADRCTECGVSLRQVIKQSEMEQAANSQRIQEQMRMQPILAEMQKKSSSALSLSSFWWIILAWVALITWIVGYSKAVNVLNMQEIDSPLAVTYKENATKARSRAKTNLIVFVVLIVLVLIISAINSNH
jgi:hypothetical protein